MSSLLDTFKAKVTAFYNTVKTTVVAFAQYFLPAAAELVEVALEDLATIAGNAVLTEAPKVLSGQEKFANAVANVVAAVEAEGKTVAVNTAKAAVQLAYLEVQKLAQSLSK
jgi:hypothetical protein